MNSNYDIFEPNHSNNEAILEEDTGEARDKKDSDNSVSYSESSQSSAHSHDSIMWVLFENFEDIAEAYKYVKNT